MKWLIFGQILLIICCIFYLLWWRAGFYPGVTVSRVTGKVGMLLYLTAAFGLAGVILSVIGITVIPVSKNVLPGGPVLLTGGILYFILLYGSSALFHRQVTSELFLIIAWAVLEVTAVGKVYSAGNLTAVGFAAMLVILAAAAVLSLVFYMGYYKAEPMKGFVYGMIPLITEGISMLVFVLMTAGKGI